MYFSYCNSKTRITRQLVTWWLIVTLACASSLSHAYAAVQMHDAHLKTPANALAICTGKGVVYVDEALFLESGIVEYIQAESSHEEHSDEGHSELHQAHTFSACELAEFTDLPSHKLSSGAVVILNLGFQATRFVFYQPNPRTHSPLNNSPRAPPAVA